MIPDDKLYYQHHTTSWCVSSRLTAGYQGHLEMWVQFPPRHIMFLQTAFITCERKVNYLSSTLSDYFCNWDIPPWIFEDGPVSNYLHMSECSRFQWDHLGGVGNWLRVLETYLETSRADWLLVMEDDILWQPNGAVTLRSYLRTQSTTGFGVISAYASKLNVYSQKRGWSLARLQTHEHLYGALAISLNRLTVEYILTHVDKFFSAACLSDSGAIHLDTAIGKVILDGGGKVINHNPTLVLHTGEVSTFGDLNKMSNRQREAREPAL